MKKRKEPPSDAWVLYTALFISSVLVSAVAVITAFSNARITIGKEASKNPPSDTVFPAAPRQLSFSDRVAYQHEIEEVYWQHRIRPKENPGPKPPLDTIVSQRQIEDKVEDYLHKSQLVADRRGSTITGFELQAEMDRMASQTKRPGVLRSLPRLATIRLSSQNVSPNRS